ncbi:MAG: cohesin domain-containing protein [Kiritimatiellae bacterium]|nr:cohesin domain-containing protein [Kiritimatiellia bacterium]
MGKTDICDGQWHLVVTTWDGSRVYLYVDGKDDADYDDAANSYGWTWSQPLIPNSLPLLIGKVSDTYSYSYFNNGSIDEVKIYNRALTTQEVQQAYNQAYNCDGLVFWNKLGSQYEVEHSEVGLSGVVTNGGFTNSGMFGGCYVAGYDQDYGIEFSRDVVPYMVGCVEFWAKLEGCPASISGGGEKPYFLEMGDGSSAWTIGFNANNGGSIGGLCGETGPHYYLGTGVYGTWSYESVLGVGQAEAWHHYALVWNKDSIAGVSDGTKKVAIYLDGQLNSTMWLHIGTNDVFIPLTNGAFRLMHNSLTQGKIYMDNLKIWNYAKTNFADRFEEGIGVGSNSVSFTVSGSPSAYGSPQPYGYGNKWVTKGTAVTNYMVSPVSGGTGVQYVCTGWTGSGDVTSGSGTNVTVTINTNSTLTWQWWTDYYLDTSAGSGGGVDVGDGWYTNGAVVTLTAAPTNGYRFLLWSGDVPSGMGTNNPLTVTMNTTRTISAMFASANAPTNGLVFWNKLGSQYEVEHSEVGLSGVVTNGGFTNSGMFGGCYVAGYDQDYGIEFSRDVVPYMVGCVEFWAKLEGCPASISGGGEKPYFLEMGDGSSAWTIGFNANNGGSIGGLCGETGPHYYLGTGVYGTWSYESVLGVGQAEAWHHYALVWNKDSIAGVSDGTKKVAIYLDGQLNSTMWLHIGTNDVFIPLTNGAFRLMHNSLTQGKIYMDNLKIWNYAKTNFADRFEEGVGAESNTVLFTVWGSPGAYGIPLPYGYATNVLSKGTIVSNSVASPVSGGTGVQYVCTGWTGSGDVTSGSGTNVTVAINTNSAITWQWRTEYYLDTSAGSGGDVDVTDGWYTNGALVAVTAVPSNGWRFVQWSGAIISSNNPITVTMNQAQSIAASFAENACVVAGQVFYTGSQSGTIYVEAFGDVNYSDRVGFTGISAPGAYAITSLPAGRNYWIRAYRDFNGNSALDSTEPTGTYCLNPVTNLLYSRGGIDITLQRLSAPQGLEASGSASCIILNWDTNPELGIAGYNVYRFDNELAVFNKLNGAPVTETMYVDRFITTGKDYYYYISAVIKSAYFSSFMESPASGIVGATAGTVTLWMPDYFGPASSVVRLRINTSDARGVLGNDMQITVSYDPSILIPISQVSTNITVEKTVLTEGMVVSNTISGGQVTIYASGTVSSSNNVRLNILGCAYESAPQDPVPLVAYFSTNNGVLWQNINDGMNINDGKSYSVDLGDLANATNCLIWIHDCRNGRDRKSNEIGDHVKLLRNGDNLGAVPRYNQQEVHPCVSKYIDKNLETHVGLDDAIYMFEFADSTNELSSFHDVVAYVEYNKGSSLIGEGRLFDVVFAVTNTAVSGTKCTNEFVSVSLKDCNGSPLAVDSSDKAVFTVQSTFILGDINGDGVVTVSGDFTLAMRMANGQLIPTEDQLRAGDIDGDGKITKIDATLIQRIALGKCINPDGGGGEPAVLGYQLSIGAFEAEPGTVVQVPVEIDNVQNIACLNLRINYDSQRLTLQSVTNTALTSSFVVEYAVGSDCVDIVMSSSDDLLSGGGAILYLNFLVAFSSNYGAIIPVTISERGLGTQYGADLSWSSGMTVSNGVIKTKEPGRVDSDGDGIPDVSIHYTESRPSGAEGFKLKWNSQVGRLYDVECSTNLIQGFFIMQKDLVGSDTEKEFTDTNTTGPESKYYKIKIH